MQINSVDLSKFQIVYPRFPTGMDTVGYRLRSIFCDLFGCTLRDGYDTDLEEHPYEILLGETNRAESADFYETNRATLLSYHLAVKGTKVILSCGGVYSANRFVDQLASDYTAEDKLEWNEGTIQERSFLTSLVAPQAEKSEVRVMTANILADRFQRSWHGYLPFIERAEIFAAILATYRPDLIGAQEADSKWKLAFPYYIDILKKNYGLDYGWIAKSWYVEKFGDKDIGCMTNILYRADKWELLEEGKESFGYSNERDIGFEGCRMLSYGVFKKRDTGKHVAVFNAHWVGTIGQPIDNTLHLDYEIPAAVNLATRLSETFENLHIFHTGDFNSWITHSEEPMMRIGNFWDSKTEARAKGVVKNDISGVRNDYCIDHIYMSKNANVLYHEVIITNKAQWLSDHLPQIADFCLS